LLSIAGTLSLEHLKQILAALEIEASSAEFQAYAKLRGKRSPDLCLSRTGIRSAEPPPEADWKGGSGQGTA
jgi:hypothetical protein